MWPSLRETAVRAFRNLQHSGVGYNPREHVPQDLRAGCGLETMKIILRDHYLYRIRYLHTKARVEEVRRRLQAINQVEALQVATNITKEGSFVRLAPTGDVNRFITLVAQTGRFPDWPTFTSWMKVHLGGKANGIGNDAVAFADALGHRHTTGSTRPCGCALPPHVCQALLTLDVDAYARADRVYNNLLAQLRAQGDPTTQNPRKQWHELFSSMKRPQTT